MPLGVCASAASASEVYGFRSHDDVINWKHFPRYWLFVRGIQRSHVNSPHKGQGPGALMFSLICAWMNGWVNSREAGDLRRHRAHIWRHYNERILGQFASRMTPPHANACLDPSDVACFLYGGVTCDGMGQSTSQLSTKAGEFGIHDDTLTQTLPTLASGKYLDYCASSAEFRFQTR